MSVRVGSWFKKKGMWPLGPDFRREERIRGGKPSLFRPTPANATHRPMVPDRVRLPLTFDPAALAADLAAHAATPWTRHVVRDNYEGDW